MVAVAETEVMAVVEVTVIDFADQFEELKLTEEDDKEIEPDAERLIVTVEVGWRFRDIWYVPEPKDSIVIWESTVTVGFVAYIGKVIVPPEAVPHPVKVAES